MDWTCWPALLTYPADMAAPRQVLAAGLTGVLLTSAGVITVAPSIHASQSDGLDVSVRGIAPLIPRVGSTLRVTGQITNLTDVSAQTVVVRLRLGTAPLAANDSEQVAEVVNEITEFAADSTQEPATRTVTAWTPVAATLDAGDQRPFSITLPVDAMQVSSPGVYVLGVEAFARTNTDGGNLTGVQRSLWPWFPEVDATSTKVKVAWLWPLVAPPAWNENDELLNDELPRALGPQGRLRALLDIGARYPNLLTWIADPALLQMVSNMRGGYLVKSDTGSRPGEQATDAATWLDELTSVLQSVQGRQPDPQNPVLYLLPYASIDASAARRADLGPDVVKAVTMGPSITAASVGLAASNTFYWAPGGLLDRQTAGLLASAGTRYVVLDPPRTDSNGQDPNGQESTGAAVRPFAPSVPGLLAVVPDPTIQQLLIEGTGDAESVLLTRQTFLALTALRMSTISTMSNKSTISTMSDVSGGPDLVLAPPIAGANSRVLAATLRATALAPWIDAVSLDQLVAQSSGGGFTYGPAGRDTELPSTYLERVRQTQQRLDRFAAVLGNPALIFEDFTQALLRAQSAAWRQQPLVGEELLTAVAADLDNRRSEIEVLNGRTVTLSGDSGRIPVTIMNSLDQPVTVGLRLVGDPRVRLTSDVVPAFTIAPGRTTSVDIPVRVAGSEPLRVSVQVLTPNGTVFRTAPVGTVYSAAYARAASWVIGLAFVAILIFVLVGIARRVLSAKRSRQAALRNDSVAGDDADESR